MELSRHALELSRSGFEPALDEIIISAFVDFELGLCEVRERPRGRPSDCCSWTDGPGVAFITLLTSRATVGSLVVVVYMFHVYSMYYVSTRSLSVGVRSLAMVSYMASRLE